jgi:hypothetical protein
VGVIPASSSAPAGVVGYKVMGVTDTNRNGIRAWVVRLQAIRQVEDLRR